MSVNLTAGSLSRQKQARDICLDGIFVETREVIKPGEEIQLPLPFSTPDRCLRLKDKVVRRRDSGVGIQFDMDTLARILNNISAKNL